MSKELKRLEILSKVSWTKEGVKKYGFSYAKLATIDGNNRVVLNFNKNKNTNSPFFLETSEKVLSDLRCGDIWYYECVLDEFDKVVPHLVKLEKNIFDTK